jgi:hypothetical protein
MRKYLGVFLPFLMAAQPGPGYWQQAVNYEMVVDLNPEDHSFQGEQRLVYYNNSPDTLNQVFYHLYFNAFQPNSMMDVRSRNLPDPDGRVKDRISKLKQEEQGRQEVLSLRMNGQACFYKAEQTILQVKLPQPIAPGDSALLEMTFKGQVPVQIRRSGRDNKEGVDYTMTQWYPKLAAYDEQGWHADPYVAREFYAPYGDFSVKISLPAEYKLGGTGVLQNFDQYWQSQSEEEGLVRYQLVDTDAERRQWHFIAENVHDFAWAADPDYIYEAQAFDDSLMLHFYYLPEYEDLWHRLPKYAIQFFKEMNKQFGRYAYPQFSSIQGGDGGMEYPMCTMMKGTGKISGLVGLLAHEGGHSWYHGIIGSNENRYPWMDEGFTSFAEEEVLNAMRKEPMINPHQRAYANHVFLAGRPDEFEPLSTPADYYARNRSYGINAYSRGQLFLAQLRYIVGEEAFHKGMKEFFEQWKFKHPQPLDLLRTIEKQSDIQLDWYYNFWVHTTKTIDYGFKAIKARKQGTLIRLEKLGEMPMPLRLTVLTKDGRSLEYYIPTFSQLGSPEEPGLNPLPSWPWTHPEYEFLLPLDFEQIDQIFIDKDGFMADINRSNNTYPSVENQE